MEINNKDLQYNTSIPIRITVLCFPGKESIANKQIENIFFTRNMIEKEVILSDINDINH